MSGRGHHSEEEDDGDVGVSSAEMMVTDPITSPSSNTHDDFLTLPPLTPEAHIPSQNGKLIAGAQSLPQTSYTPLHNALIESSYMSPATYGGFRDPDFFEGFQESSDPNASSNRLHSLSQATLDRGKNIPIRSNTTMTIPLQNNVTSVTANVVIIEPIPDHRASESFFGNYIKLAKSIKASLFGTTGIKDINKNFKRKIIIVTLNPGNEDKLSDLLKVTEIGNWQVTCRLPRSQSISYGVVGPFGPDVSNDELTEVLVESGYANAKVTRILKTANKINTWMFKVMLETSSLPEYIYLEYQ